MKKKWALFALLATAPIWILLRSSAETTNDMRSNRASIPELPSHVADVHFDIDPPCRKYSPIGCMVFISGGDFVMGAQNREPTRLYFDPEANDNEGPPHEVEVDSFWIHKEEVKTIQYKKCVDMGACPLEGVNQEGGYFNWGNEKRAEHPINGVSWHAANTYCEWLKGRLPTEAEWEYAARSSKGHRYPWGDTPPTCDTVKISSEECGIDGTSSRPSYLGRSDFGVEDMSGSLWEWTADWYAKDTYANSEEESPTGPPNGTRRSIRGGGWMDEELSDFRSTVRAALDPDIAMNDLGFRCVRPHSD